MAVRGLRHHRRRAHGGPARRVAQGWVFVTPLAFTAAALGAVLLGTVRRRLERQCPAGSHVPTTAYPGMLPAGVMGLVGAGMGTEALHNLRMADKTDLDPQARGTSSWTAASPYAARHRFAGSLSAHSGRQKAKAKAKAKARRSTHSLPVSTYSAPGALRQDPGRGAESSAEAATCGNQGFTKYVRFWPRRGSRGTPNRRGTRGAAAGTRRTRAGAPRRRTARSTRPEINLVQWGFR